MIGEENLQMKYHHLHFRPEEERFMGDEGWDKFEEMVRQQLKKGEYTSYIDLEKAKEHSRKLKK